MRFYKFGESAGVVAAFLQQFSPQNQEAIALLFREDDGLEPVKDLRRSLILAVDDQLIRGDEARQDMIGIDREQGVAKMPGIGALAGFVGGDEFGEDFGDGGVTHREKSEAVQSGQAGFEICDGAVKVGVVTDDQGGVVEGELGKAVEKLGQFCEVCREGFGAAVDDYQRRSEIGGDAASQEAAVVRFIAENVFVAGREVRAMRLLGVEQFAIGVNPEYEVGSEMGEFLDGVSSPGKAFGKERKDPGSGCAGDGADGQHGGVLATSDSRFTQILLRWRHSVSLPTMLETLHIRGYRSLRDFRLTLGRVTVVTGENGVGKSKLYRALALMQRMADGRFAEALAEEGGMPSLLWAGERRKDESHRISWKLDHADFHFSMECGIMPAAGGSAFSTDPDVKLETLRYGGEKGRIVAKRKGPMVELRDQEGGTQVSPLPFHASESMLSEVRDGIRYPALGAVREVFLAWRFYHVFRTDLDSTMRRARLGSRSPVLAHDGSNLAATLQTIRESGLNDSMEEAIQAAFPGMEWAATDGSGMFQLEISRPGLRRMLTANELSDGTLRFFCLCAALSSPKPPPLLVLNEPETSLHPDLLMPLAGLIARVPEETQLLIVTHSQELAAAVGERCQASQRRLITAEGETRLEGQGTSRRVWTFGD